MTKIIFLLICGFGVLAAAEDKPDLMPHYNYAPKKQDDQNGIEGTFIDVKEKTVTIGGAEFRQVEYDGKYYYLNMKQPVNGPVQCNNVTLPKDTFAVDGEWKITKYTHVYLESLRQSCQGDRIVTNPNPLDTHIGVSVKGNKPDSTTQKVYVNPFSKIGAFSTDF